MDSLVGEVVRTGGHQVRAESALGGGDTAQVVILKKSKEEPLNKVLGPVVIVPLTAHERIQRIPVGLAECGKGFACFGATMAPGREDEAPVRCPERRSGGQFMMTS